MGGGSFWGALMAARADSAAEYGHGVQVVGR